MTAIRFQIRAAIVQALKNKTRAGVRVFPCEINDIWSHELPAIAVYTTRSQDRVDTNEPREYLRTQEIAVELYLEQRSDAQGDVQIAYDDDLDAFSQEVETALHIDRTLGGVSSDLRFVRTEISGGSNGERDVTMEQKVVEIDAYVRPCEGDPAQVFDVRTIGLRLDLPGKGETTTTTSPTADGQRDIPLPPP